MSELTKQAVLSRIYLLCGRVSETRREFEEIQQALEEHIRDERQALRAALIGLLESEPCEPCRDDECDRSALRCRCRCHRLMRNRRAVAVSLAYGSHN